MIKTILQILLSNKLLTGIILALSTLTIIYLTLSPADQIGDFSVYQYDKLGHFALFFGWTFFFGLMVLSFKEANTNLLFVFIMGTLFGIAIEVLQGVLPYGRSPNIGDAIADIIGTFFATMILYLIKRRYWILGELIVKKNKK